MACKYCENHDISPLDWSLGDVIIIDAAKYTFVGDGNTYSIPLNYCPACGKALSYTALQREEQHNDCQRSDY